MAETNTNVSFMMGKGNPPEKSSPGTVYFSKDIHSPKGAIYMDDENGNRYQMSNAIDDYVRSFSNMEQFDYVDGPFDPENFLWNIEMINEQIGTVKKVGAFVYTERITDTTHPNFWNSIKTKLLQDGFTTMSSHTGASIRIERAGDIYTPLNIEIVPEYTADDLIGTVYSCIVNRNGVNYYISPFVQKTVPEGFVKKPGVTVGNQTTPVYVDSDGLIISCSPMMTAQVVWENASPNNPLPPQTISFSEIDSLPAICIIEFRSTGHNSNGGYYYSSATFLNPIAGNYGYCLQAPDTDQIGGSVTILDSPSQISRRLTFESNGDIIFAQGYKKDTADAYSVIPTKITYIY